MESFFGISSSQDCLNPFMCCCCRKKRDLEVKFSGRHCTDPLCLVLFAAAWFVSIIVLIAAHRTADMASLSNGRDYNGNVCGSQTNPPGSVVLNCPTGVCDQVYYPRLTEDVSISLAFNTSFSMFGICLPSCPSARDVVCTYNYTDNKGLPPFDDVIQCTNGAYRLTHGELCTNCWAVPLNTSSVMNRCVPVVTTERKTTARCVMPESPADPTDPAYIDPSSPSCLAQSVEETETYTRASSEDVLTNALVSVQVFVNRYMSDIRSCYLVLAVGVAVSFVLGFVFLLLLKTCSKFVIWCTIVLGLLLCVLVTLLCFQQAQLLPVNQWFNFLVSTGDEYFHWGNLTFENIVENLPDYLASNDRTVVYWEIAAYVMAAFTLVLLFVVIAMGHSVNVSVEQMKKATIVLGRTPSILLVPMVVTVVNVALFCFFAWAYSLTLSSSLSLSDYTDEVLRSIGAVVSKNDTAMLCEDPETMTNCTFISRAIEKGAPSDVVLGFWHLFMFLWSSGLVNAIGVMAVAGTVGKWYFKKEDERISITTLSQALLCAVGYHLGSAAYGALLISLIQLARAIMLYIDNRFKKSQSGNPLVKCGMKCCHCCLLCLEKCMKYISRNAYILVIMRGTNFFKSSVESFSLLASNIGAVTVLKSVSTLFIWMGKVANIVISTLVVQVMIRFCPDWITHPIVSFVGPTVVIVILSYLVSTIFIQVFVIAVDTTMLCYCEDLKKNGTDGVDKKAQKAAQAAQAAQTTPDAAPVETAALAETTAAAPAEGAQ